ncbi:MAG: MBL fold metallo-hydrolase [Acholeplasmataceae bacterium]|jgi:phosphoribosyl 1,2-cyclic phosphodiesterase|nr:MBL fold metallo-hydrolase [Acholeplasmataceae bacterium]
MEIFVLASGSKGNITYLKVGDVKLFIDAGISYQKIKSKMTDYKENLFDVKTLLITHEHHDHIMGLKMLLKYGSIEHVYLTKGTLNSLPVDVANMFLNTHIIEADNPFFIDHVKVTPFMLSHDAEEPVGFVVEDDEHKLVLLTDTGYVDESYYPLLSDAHLYILEANHNPFTLFQSPRPFLLKKRIVGEKGHLSNDDAARLMNQLIHEKSIWVVAHISEDCNCIDDIDEAIVKAFDDPTKVEVYYASQEGLEVIKL